MKNNFIKAIITFAFRPAQNTVSEWNTIFLIGAVAYIIPAVLFMVFGSGNIQPWNEIPVQSLAEAESGVDTNVVVAPVSGHTNRAYEKDDDKER